MSDRKNNALKKVNQGHVTYDKSRNEELSASFPFIKLEDFEPDKKAIEMLSASVCEKYKIIPISKTDEEIVVAFANVSRAKEIKVNLQLSLRLKINLVLADEALIKQTIEKHFASQQNKYGNIFKGMAEQLDQQGDDGVSEAFLLEETKGEQAGVVRFVSEVLNEAIKTKASDIHIEQYEKSFRVRFRIDGSLLEKIHPPQAVATSIVSRLKIMCKMDISERRRPQDGRLKVKLKSGKEVDFRVNSVPCLFGEKIVLRLLDQSNLQVDMRKLGFEDDQLAVIEKVIQQPQGLVLITGPTGSGKTTTIYSCLAELNQPDINLSTAEDPVEFNLNGINQVQVKSEIGFTFAEALRAFLRQDPDIIMVGEIRDLETANVAYKAASTGHLVFSTLHTNDAASTVSRLLDMGVPGFMVADSTSLIVAQRLIKTNCQKCLEPLHVEKEILLELGVKEEELDEYKDLKQGAGCHNCNNTGLSGRLAIHEVLQITPEVKEAIFKSASPLEIKKSAVKSGMLSLRGSALLKLKRGLTNVKQVLSSSLSDPIDDGNNKK